MFNYVFDKTFSEAHFINVQMLIQKPRYEISFHVRGSNTQATELTLPSLSALHNTMFTLKFFF